MAKLLIAFNLVSKEESVQQLAPQQLMSISLWLLPREWRAQHKLFWGKMKEAPLLLQFISFHLNLASS